MNKTLLNKMRETFQDLDKLKPEQMEALMNETFQAFLEMDKVVKSKDTRKQEEALEFAYEMKEMFEEQAESLWKMSGLDPEEFTNLIQNQSPPTGELKKLLDTFEKNLSSLKEPVKPTLKKQFKTKTRHIIG